MLYIHEKDTALVPVTEEARAGAVMLQDLLQSSFCKAFKTWHCPTHLVHSRAVFLAGVLKAAQFSFQKCNCSNFQGKHLLIKLSRKMRQWYPRFLHVFQAVSVLAIWLEEALFLCLPTSECITAVKTRGDVKRRGDLPYSSSHSASTVLTHLVHPAGIWGIARNKPLLREGQQRLHTKSTVLEYVVLCYFFIVCFFLF